MPRSTRKGLYRVIYLVRGRRATVPATLQFDAAMREFAALKRRGFTTWIESDSGEFVPVEGAMRKPKEIVDEHRVADFNSIPELIEHAKGEGASAILVAGQQVTLYFPRRDGRYDAATIWNQNGYWHAPSKSARSIVTRLPAGAESIGSHTQRVGRRASEARAEPQDPQVYLSFSEGKYRVIRQGMPISADKDTSEEALQVAKQFGLKVSGNMWNGDIGQWVPLWRAGPAKQPPSPPGRRGRHLEAPRRRLSRPNLKMTPESALQLAGELSQAVGGSKPRTLPGGYRFSDKNEAAQFTTYSPEYNQKVVCVVSVFEDGSTAIGIFSDEGLSGTATYENIAHFTYDGADIPVMKKDIEWVWKTVDGYAASWQEDEDGEVDEARSARESRRRRAREAPEPVDDPFYIIQGLYNGPEAYLAGREFGFDDEQTALDEAKKLLKSSHFEGDYVRVLTRDGELVWDSRGGEPSGRGTWLLPTEIPRSTKRASR
jgi:hypothetical protein